MALGQFSAFARTCGELFFPAEFPACTEPYRAGKSVGSEAEP